LPSSLNSCPNSEYPGASASDFRRADALIDAGFPILLFDKTEGDGSLDGGRMVTLLDSDAENDGGSRSGSVCDADEELVEVVEVGVPEGRERGGGGGGPMLESRSRPRSVAVLEPMELRFSCMLVLGRPVPRFPPGMPLVVLECAGVESIGRWVGVCGREAFGELGVAMLDDDAVLLATEYLD
jgi:hypothetical protein